MNKSATLRCAVIDDEPLARELIQSYIARTPGLIPVGEFESAAIATPRVLAGEFDLLFLDINIPGLNGIELGEIVPESTRIVYTTAYDEYAIEAYRVNALDYLLKPISYPEFAKAVAKAFEWKIMRDAYLSREREGQPDSQPLTFITVKSDYRLVRLRLDTLLYVEVKGDRLIFYRDDGEEISSLMSMKEIEEILPPDRFMRIHRSFIVNLDRVEVVERNRIVFGRTYVPIAESRRDDFLQRIAGR